MTIYCATTNPGKLREFQQSGLDIQPLPGLKEIAAPEETGKTFEANAITKAEYYSRFANHELLFAEDSGLEVDSLGGEPGVHSARYAGPQASDAANNKRLLVRLQGAESAARYVCVIALARDGHIIATFRGTVEGRVIPRESGTGGFGYDPMFFYPPFGRTFAEATLEEKMSVSHRTAALRQLAAHLASAESRS